MEFNTVNVSDMERILSAGGGAAIAFYGLTRNSFCGAALTAVGGMLLHRGISGYCPAYGALEIDTADPEKKAGIRISETMTIKRPRQEVYAFWRDFEKLPRFMRHIESVEIVDDRHSQWRLRLPKGLGTISWESEITKEQPNEYIAWQSLPKAAVHNTGKVAFTDAPGERGTEINIVVEFRPPAGQLGRTAAGLVNPAFSKMIRQDIRRVKSFMETGEIPTIEGQPSGS